MESEFEEDADETFPDWSPREARWRHRIWMVLCAVAVGFVVLLLVTATLRLVFFHGLPGPLAPPTTAMVADLAGTGTCGSSHTYNLTLNPSKTLTTASFEVYVSVPDEPPLPPGPASAGLGPGCSPAPSTFFGVLWSEGGAPLATFSNTTVHSGWTALAGSSLPVSVIEGVTLEIVSTSDLAKDDAVFQGTGGSTVVGSAAL